jgi:hypothetical protein
MNIINRIISWKKSPWIPIISLGIGLINISLMIHKWTVLDTRIEKLEVARLTGLFRVKEPPNETPLPARMETKLNGDYVQAVPQGYNVRAALFNGNEYFVARTRPQFEPDRKWSLLIRPWPGRWKVHICIADEEGTKEMDKWAAEPSWDNGRQSLPKGVIPNSIFEYEAK